MRIIHHFAPLYRNMFICNALLSHKFGRKSLRNLSFVNRHNRAAATALAIAALPDINQELSNIYLHFKRNTKRAP